jgi:hypothetical protein
MDELTPRNRGCTSWAAAGDRLCGARSRRNGGAPCRNWGMAPSGRCRLHGGKSAVGFASPTFKHGWYSHDFVTQHLAAYGAAMASRAEAEAAAVDLRVSRSDCDTVASEGMMNTPCNADNPMGGRDVRGSGTKAGGTTLGRSGARRGLPLATCHPDEVIAVGVANQTRSGRTKRREQGPTPQQVGRAALLCYVDADCDEAIARQLGIARRTLARWKCRLDFAAAHTALELAGIRLPIEDGAAEPRA